jgi:hypothetical protein
MNPKNNENNQPKVLLLEAPKPVPRDEETLRPVEANEGISEAPSDPSDDRISGQLAGRDPETGRFLPGNGGRPYGVRIFSTLFRDAIKEIGGTSKDGKKVTYDKIIAKKMITMAAEGNLKAAGMVIERVDGKVPQSFEVNKTERIGVYIMTPKEIEDHESIFKRKYVEPEIKNNNATSDSARNEDTPGSEQGSAYETR